MAEVDLERAAHNNCASLIQEGDRFNSATALIALRAPLRVMPVGRAAPAEKWTQN